MKHCAYIKVSAEAKVSVLMIHGICSTPRHFDSLLPYIPDNVDVYNILLDGHGGSALDFGRTSMKKWRSQVREMLKTLSKRYEKILVVGHSMGTLLAIDALPEYPKVCSLLLLNPPFRPWVKAVMPYRVCKFSFGCINTDNPHEIACFNDSSIEFTTKLWRYLRCVPRFLELLCLCRRCRRDSGNITVSCKAFLGKQDELVSLRSRKYLQDKENVDLFVLNESGHFYFPEEERKKVTTEFQKLLSEVI